MCIIEMGPSVKYMENALITIKNNNKLNPVENVHSIDPSCHVFICATVVWKQFFVSYKYRHGKCRRKHMLSAIGQVDIC